MLKRTLLAASLVAFPAAAEASDVIQPSTVSRSANIAGGATRTLELSCRAPAIALNATASGLPAGAELRRSSPSAGVLGWSLELAAADGAARQRLGASLRCLRLELPNGVKDVTLGAATRRTPSVSVPAGATRSTSVRCERGYIPTGYGVDRGGEELRLSAALANARGWSFRIANPGSAAAEVGLVIRCTRAKVEGVRSGAPVSLRLETRRAGFSDSVQGGRSLRHSCRAGEFSIATGFSLPSGIELDSAQPTGARGGLWRLRGSGGGVETQLICLARDSTFR